MKLVTKAIEKKLPEIYETDGTPLAEKKVVVKFFTPWSNWTWFVFEGDKLDDGDYEFFGMVHGLTHEMGYFRLSDLQKNKGVAGLRVERDRSVDGDLYGEGKL